MCARFAACPTDPGTLAERLGIFLGLIRGIFKLMFYKCSACTGGTCWGA